ncbi:MAG: 50S ribosomal protein L5 [Chloroflexi bacterium]|nr:50S ribosomal protein L5 [Chloroflexota bacterium]
MADRKQQPQPARGPAAPARRGQGTPGRQDAALARERREPEFPPPPTGPRPTPRLRQRYDEEVRGTLMQEFNYKNVMQAPKVEKLVINIGLGEAISNPRALDAAVGDLQAITGQKPVVTRAKKSIASFKVRAGQEIGAMVTLRGARMYDFLDKLVNVALPRVRDFSGVSPEAFDGRGNFNLGLREQLIFPEIEYDKIDRVRGMEIAVVTTAKSDEEGRRLLQLMGMPFRTDGARHSVASTEPVRTRRRAR